MLSVLLLSMLSSIGPLLIVCPRLVVNFQEKAFVIGPSNVMSLTPSLMYHFLSS